MTLRTVGASPVVGLAVFLTLSGVYVASPVATPFDSRWTVHTALSIIHEGNTDLGEYLPLLVRDRFYAIECVDSARGRFYPPTTPADCPSGHYFNFCPVSVAAMALPEVWTLETILKLGQHWLRPLSERMPTEARRNFLQADLVSSSMMTELLVASFMMAVAGVQMYCIAGTVLPSGWAAFVTIIFGLCTPAWSTSSRALWQHGPSSLLLTAALLLLIRRADSPRLAALAGAPLAVAFFVRPTNIVALLALTVYVFHHHRKQLGAFLAVMAPIALIHTAYTLANYGAWLSPCSFVSRSNAPGLSVHPEFVAALVGNLVSRARGCWIMCRCFCSVS